MSWAAYKPENERMASSSPDRERQSPPTRLNKTVIRSSIKEDEKQKSKRRSWNTARDKESIIQNNEALIKRQRELEQFLLSQQIKRLRGTTWKYYLITSDLGENTDENEGGEKICSDSGPLGILGKDGLNKDGGIAKDGDKDLRDINKEVMVIIHGGGIRPEAMYEQMIKLSKDYIILAPLLPEELSEFEDYAAGIILIMNHEKITRAHFYGLGFGGMVATYVLYRNPNRVRKLIVSHSTMPLNFNEKAEKILRKGEECPKWLRRVMVGTLCKPKNIDRDIPDITQSEKDHWLYILKKFAASKQELISRTTAMVDYYNNCFLNFTKQDFAASRARNDHDGTANTNANAETTNEKRILVIESEDEPFFSREAFEDLKQVLTPTVQIYKNTGHLFGLIRGREIVDCILHFLKEDKDDRKSLDDLSLHDLHDTSTSLNDFTDIDNSH